MLHHLRTLILIRYQRPFFYPKMPVNKGFPAIRLFQTEVSMAVFMFSPPVASRVFLHDTFWLPYKFTRFRLGFDEIRVVIDLRFITGELFITVRGNAGVPCHPAAGCGCDWRSCEQVPCLWNDGDCFSHGASSVRVPLLFPASPASSFQPGNGLSIPGY